MIKSETCVRRAEVAVGSIDAEDDANVEVDCRIVHGPTASESAACCRRAEAGCGYGDILVSNDVRRG